MYAVLLNSGPDRSIVVSETLLMLIAHEFICVQLRTLEIPTEGSTILAFSCTLCDSKRL